MSKARPTLTPDQAAEIAEVVKQHAPNATWVRFDDGEWGIRLGVYEVDTWKEAPGG